MGYKNKKKLDFHLPIDNGISILFINNSKILEKTID
jgi:hypothetical protein